MLDIKLKTACSSKYPILVFHTLHRYLEERFVQVKDRLRKASSDKKKVVSILSDNTSLVLEEKNTGKYRKDLDIYLSCMHSLLKQKQNEITLFVV